jgi:hypothetical protein
LHCALQCSTVGRADSRKQGEIAMIMFNIIKKYQACMVNFARGNASAARRAAA